MNMPIYKIQGTIESSNPTLGTLKVDLTIGMDIDQLIDLVIDLYPRLVERAPEAIDRIATALGRIDVEQVAHDFRHLPAKVEAIKARIERAIAAFQSGEFDDNSGDEDEK